MTEAAEDVEPEHWLERHGDVLYGYALLRVRDAAAAEDLVQETLLAALRARDGFAARSSTRTWLVGILKNKVVDHLRRRGREETFDATLIDDETWAGKFDHTGHWSSPPARWSEPAFAVENAELGTILRTCIEHLPDRYRTLFVLREVDGLGTDELLAALGISSPNNLWVMLSRARERVRACIERTWPRGT